MGPCVRTEEAQIEDWTTGILGEMVFQKVLQDQGIEVGPVNLSVMPKGDGGSDFKVVIMDGEIRTLKIPLDVKAVRLGSWLLIPESSFRKDALYALVSVGYNEGDIEGMAFGWMFQDNDRIRFSGSRRGLSSEGDGRLNCVLAGAEEGEDEAEVSGYVPGGVFDRF